MLTVDLVSAFRKGDRLHVRRLSLDARARAFEIAAAYIEIAENHIGLSREAFEQTCAAVPLKVYDRKLAAGLLKLITDRCEFEMSEETDPVALRQRVFMEASRIRRSAEQESDFQRDAVLADAGGFFDMSAEAVDRLLYADLKSAHRLIAFKTITAEQLVRLYDRGQGQAVLLKATGVSVTVHADTAALYRRLFFKLKFLGLLHVIHRLSGGGYRIDIEGPFSMFQSVTKYGLKLALLVPALEECGRWTLDAKLLWGKEKQRLKFHLEGDDEAPSDSEESGPRLADDVAKLTERFSALDTDWTVSSSTDILELPGAGLCVPDLQFVHRSTGEVVYLEVMGFWSRDAVWKRIELVEAGLPFHIIFAVSKHLRVSEQVLSDDLPGSLYVYKTSMNAPRIKTLLDRFSTGEKRLGRRR